MKLLKDLDLTKEEIDFVKTVYQNPWCKLNSDQAFGENGEALWENPERLNVIECMGSFKWKPKNLEMELVVVG